MSLKVPLDCLVVLPEKIILGPNYCHRAEQIAIEAPRATLISSTSRLRALELELGPVP